MQISYTGINATRWFASLLAPSETGLAKRSRQVPNEVAARLHGTHWKIQTSSFRPISHHFSPRNLRARPTTYNIYNSFSPQHRGPPDPPGHPMAPWPHGPMASAGPPDRRSRSVARWAVDLIAIQAIHSWSWCSSCHVCHVCHVSWLPSSTKLGENMRKPNENIICFFVLWQFHENIWWILVAHPWRTPSFQRSDLTSLGLLELRSSPWNMGTLCNTHRIHVWYIC